MASEDVYGGLARRFLDPAPKWIAALFILAYFTMLGLRILRVLYMEWGFARINYLLYSFPSPLTGVIAVALRYRHKTLHKGLLTKIVLATAIAYTVLARGLSAL
jgi:hypothetical protein